MVPENVNDLIPRIYGKRNLPALVKITDLKIWISS